MLFSDSLAGAMEGRLITNEYAHWNPGLGVESPDWEMTSGSLFAGGWTGVPDDCAPNRLSSDCTNSAVFRLNTKRSDFGDVRVDAQLRGNAWASTSTTPAVDWDGVHLWLRYQDEQELYYASVARRDGSVVVKKKCPGGPSNDGTYHTLGSRESLPLPLGEWGAVGASIHTAADDSVVIDVFREDRRVLTATDSGTGCAPITADGAVGVRGDNLDFNARDFRVTGPEDTALALRPVSRRFRRALRVRVRTGASIHRVKLSLRGRRIGVDRHAPFRLRHAPSRRLRAGIHVLRVTGYDPRGRRVASDAMRVRYLGPRTR